MNPLLERAQLIAAAREWASSGAARIVRQAAGMSVREMAELVGVSPHTIGRWENRITRPRGNPGARYGDVLRTLMDPNWHLARREHGPERDRAAV
jgi:transcriptional regulator with XRE-family HTH domain